MKDLNYFLNESKSNYDLKDFEFYSFRTSKGLTYSFIHKPTKIEADIITAKGSFGKGSSQSVPYVDYLEFSNNEPNEKTVEELESFIENNLKFITDNSKKI